MARRQPRPRREERPREMSLGARSATTLSLHNELDLRARRHQRVLCVTQERLLRF